MRYQWPAAIVLALIATALYLPTLRNGFVFDDTVVLRDSVVVDQLQYREALTGPYWPTGDSSNWRPLATLSFLLDRQLMGMVSPMSLHAVNALLHGLVVLALFPVARRLAGAGWPALAACALFAAHPAHTEVVAPVVGRTDLLAALGALLALACFLRYRDGPQARWLVVGALAYAVGLGGKESAAPLLLILPAVDWLVRCRSLRALWGRESLAYLPFLAVAILYFALRQMVLGDASFHHTHAVDYTFLERLVFAARNAVVSVSLLLVPIRFHHMLTTLPDNAPFNYADPTGVAAAAYVIGGLVVTLGWLALRRRAPRGAFCWLAAVVFWLPTSGLLPTAAGASMRFLFLPTAFFGCGLVIGLAGVRRAQLKVVLGWALAVVLVLAAGLSVWRSTKWRTEETFYEAILAEEPDCHIAHLNLGARYWSIRKPDLDKAEMHFRAAVRITGDSVHSVNSRFNLAQLLEHRGQSEQARRQYLRVLELDPDFFSRLGRPEPR